MANGDIIHPDPYVPGPNPSTAGGGYAWARYGKTDRVTGPQWSVTENGRGLLEGNVTIQYQGSMSNPKLPNLPKRGDPHPHEPALKCYKSSTQFGSAGSVTVTADYIGLMQDPTIPEVEISGSTATQSLQLHPNFVGLAMSIPPTAANPKYKFKPYVDTVNNNRKDFERFNCTTAPEGMRGMESYAAPRANVHVTFYTANRALALKYVSNVGCWATIPPDLDPLAPVPTNASYMLMSSQASLYGSVYKISAEWTMAEQGATIPKEIYRQFGSGGKASTGFKYSIGGDYNIGAKWTF